MTPEQLAEIAARANAATPGPWEAGDVWYTAGLIFNDKGDRVGPKGATRCAYCHLGEPVEAARMNINGTKMRAHRHHVSDPYTPEHRISSADGGTVAGNYDYEEGGILRAEDTQFITHAREDVPALLAEVKRLSDDLNAAIADNRELDEQLQEMASGTPGKSAPAAILAAEADRDQARDRAQQLHDRVVELTGLLNDANRLTDHLAKLREFDAIADGGEASC